MAPKREGFRKAQNEARGGGLGRTHFLVEIGTEIRYTHIISHARSLFMWEVKSTACGLVRMTCFASWRAQTIAEVLCHEIFF